MPSEVLMSTLLESLPPRPPTPPREPDHETFAPPRLILGPNETRSNIHTPPGIQSPGGSITTNSTTRSKKKVEFSAQAEYREAPVHPEGEAKGRHTTPVSLPRSASKPVKSILKITHFAANPLSAAYGNTGDPHNADTNLVEMLESTIQQLAGGDRDSKVDAYVMLTRACKTSNNLPDRVALQEKMGLFTQFIQRDMVSRSQEGAADASLSNHALNLFITFLGFPAVASAISNDFGVFVIDHCIRSFEDVAVPKDVARHLMKVISLQNFSSKVMTSDRVGRLMSSLHRITNHIDGKSIAMSRIHIYRKLVKQCKQLMVLHSDWLFDLFTDMLSSMKEIRSSAISLGLEAAFCIGHEKQLSRKVVELFNTSSEDKRYIELYHESLQTMAKDRNESATVPDIWSVVILLLRIPLSMWDGAKPWLEIMQSCFNSSDFPTKINANRAWSRLVFLMHSDDRWFARRLPTLTNPLISQLRRRVSGRMTEDLRNTILGGICNLLYYVFRPNTKHDILETYWDSSMKPIFATLLDSKSESAKDNIRQASLILGGLFDCRTPRRWREDHIVESPLVKPEELPAIDSKWVRCNARKVFDVVGPILENDFLALAHENSATYKLWQALVSTIASAASKEIKVSKDTVVFVSEAFNVLQRVWKCGLGDGAADSRGAEFLAAAQAYLLTMVHSLGLLPFTEKPGKSHSSAKAHIYTLFSMLSALPRGIPDDSEFATAFSSIFTPFFASKTDKAKMDLALELLAVIPMESPRPYGPWLLVSTNVVSWLGSGHSSHLSTASGNEVPVGNDYREIVKVLERGVRSTPKLPWEHWESLFYALFERARDETGDAGFGHVAIEPLSKALLDSFSTPEADAPAGIRIKCVTELLSVATQPRDRQAFDASRRRLWGTSLAGGRSSSFDVFDQLYKAVSETLGHLYQEFSVSDSAAAASLLEELGGFFDRCNKQLFLKSLVGFQDGLLPWIHDVERLLCGSSSTVLAIMTSLWDKLVVLIAGIEHPEQQLETLERVFCASLESPNRQIANSSVCLWNRLFEHADNLDYPNQLKAVLLRLQPHVDIFLPGLEVFSKEYTGERPFFMDSVDALSLPKLPFTTPSRRGNPRPVSSSRARSPELGSFDGLPKRQQTPARKTSETTRCHTTPRLRHDNSQLKFAPIEPSPSGRELLESQVLTERQREVRERQKENAALFPEIQSSPGPKPNHMLPLVGSRDFSLMQSQAREAVTPEPEGTFDSFVSSTPTPRRGQLVVIPEHDMPDLPSSPPEPRGNPLAAEIRSRSVSHSLMDEWQFSSSPVSGSPNPVRQFPVVEPLGPEQLSKSGNLALEADSELALSQEDAGHLQQENRSFSAEDDVVEDTILPDLPQMPRGRDLPKQVPLPPPSTPRRSTRSSHVQETPKSDNEVFVDAPTSPLPASPRRSEKTTRSTRASRLRDNETVPTQAPSHAGSDVEDRSSVRFVVELDSGKVNSSDYRRPTESPDKKPLELGVEDCIVVVDSPRKPGETTTSQRASANSISSFTGAEGVSSPQPLARETRGKRKRKRSTTSEIITRKKRHPTPVNEGYDQSEVPDSQPSSAVKGVDCSQAASGCSPKALFPSTACLAESLVEGLPVSLLTESHPESRVSRKGRSPKGIKSCPADPVELERSQAQAHDRDVQSQIALESQMDVDTNCPTIVRLTEQAEAAEPEGYVQRFISMLRTGAELLLSVPQVSTEEVWEAEDALMEVTRALHEAKRRGRR